AGSMLGHRASGGPCGPDGRKGAEREGAAAPSSGAGRRAPVRTVGEPASYLRCFVDELRSLDEIDAAAAGHGLISVDVEGGVVRHLPVVARVGEALLPTLGLEMLRVAEQQSLYSVHVGPFGVEAVSAGQYVIPTQPDGSVLIHFTHHDP